MTSIFFRHDFVWKLENVREMKFGYHGKFKGEIPRKVQRGKTWRKKWIY